MCDHVADVYTIVVTNNGPSTVSSVTLTDTIPAALLNPSFGPSAGIYDLGTGVWSGAEPGDRCDHVWIFEARTLSTQPVRRRCGIVVA
jgi:uncharacterized repeat protein (TIGR01451 family)